MSNTLDRDQIDALSRLPSLKGAPLSIFVAMLIAQQPLLARELRTYTGLANGAITSGLRTLEDLKAVLNLGHRGWVLSPGWQQLLLPLEFLTEPTDHENRDKDHENRDLPPLLVVSSRSPEGEDLLTNHQEPPANHENRDLGPENTVPGWLALGGLAPGSPKMRLLAQKIQSPEYAKAHVLEHLFEQREWQRHRNGREPGTGTLIYRLEHNWPAPGMRCFDCLELERDCGCNGRVFIPAGLEEIVRR